MHWNDLTQIEQLVTLDEESKTKNILIFKHSKRCNISSAALDRIERKWEEKDLSILKPYYLDLIAYRNISNAIAERYQVLHESPQILVIENGLCSYTKTHFDISYDGLMQNFNA